MFFKNVYYIQYSDKEGKIKPKRDVAEFRGTSLYASVNIHDCEDQCPRDDLWSVMYVFIDLLCGKLPWSEAARSREKAKVGLLKKEFEPTLLLDWMANVLDNAGSKDGVSTFTSLYFAELLNICKYYL